MSDKYTYKIATEADLAYTDEIEKEALPIIEPYYRKNIQIFGEEIEGELIIVYDGDYPVGMGRYSLHPDQTMWLETVRVRPSHQRKGIGKGIYERYLEAAQKAGVKTVRLYTEGFNEKSMGLTQKMGYKIIQKYDYYSLKQEPSTAAAKMNGFARVSELDEVMDYIQDHPWTEFLCMNNVFYEVNRANLQWFLDQGMIYRKEDSLMIVGARHNKDSVAYLAYMAGDYAACVEAAVAMNPGKTVSAGISKKNAELGKYFSDFEKRYDLVVSEKNLLA